MCTNKKEQYFVNSLRIHNENKAKSKKLKIL